MAPNPTRRDWSGLALWWPDLRGHTESAKPAVSERCAAKEAEDRRLIFLRFRGTEVVDDDTFGGKDTEGVIRIYIFPLQTHNRNRFRYGRVNAGDLGSFLP